MMKVFKKEIKEEDMPKPTIHPVLKYIFWGSLAAYFFAHFSMALIADKYEMASWIFLGGIWCFVAFMNSEIAETAKKIIFAQNSMIGDILQTLEQATGMKKGAPDKLPDGSVKSPFQIL